MLGQDRFDRGTFGRHGFSKFVPAAVVDLGNIKQATR